MTMDSVVLLPKQDKALGVLGACSLMVVGPLVMDAAGLESNEIIAVGEAGLRDASSCLHSPVIVVVVEITRGKSECVCKTCCRGNCCCCTSLGARGVPIGPMTDIGVVVLDGGWLVTETTLVLKLNHDGYGVLQMK